MPVIPAVPNAPAASSQPASVTTGLAQLFRTIGRILPRRDPAKPRPKVTDAPNPLGTDSLHRGDHGCDCPSDTGEAAGDRVAGGGNARPREAGERPLRGVFDGLVESLDATLRISRWTGTDLVPDPLKSAAAALVDRLGTANRLAADRFAGSPHVVASMVEISGGIKRLDNAYVEFRRSLAGNPTPTLTQLAEHKWPSFPERR